MAYTFQKIDDPNQTATAGVTITNLLGINDLQQVVGFYNATAIGLSFTLPASSATTPTITSVMYPGDAQTQVVAVNIEGNTAGFTVDKSGTTHGFTDIGGTFAFRDAPNTKFNQALGINDFGEVVGYSSVIPAGNVQQLADYYLAGSTTPTYVNLPTNFNSQTTGVDDSGDLVGFYQPTSTTFTGFYIPNNTGIRQSISVPGSTSTTPNGMNSNGQIVGFFVDSAGVTHGFIYSLVTGAYTTIDYPGATATTINGIDNSGQVAGFYTDATGNQHGFVGLPPAATVATGYAFQKINAPNDTITNLLGVNDAGDVVGFHGATAAGLTFTLPSVAGVTPTISAENYPGATQTQVVAINKAGSTAGFFVDSSGATHGFTDIGGTFASINAPNTAFNQLLGINDVGEAVGYSSVIPAGNTQQIAYSYNIGIGVFNYLNLPTNTNSQATGVDDKGDIVGFFMLSPTTEESFYLTPGVVGRRVTTPGTLNILSAPGSTFTQANGMNNEGQVVGFYIDHSGFQHGFLYTVATQTWVTIDSPGSTSTTINGINDAGVLAGFYVDSTGNTDGFVGTPSTTGTTTQTLATYRFETINASTDGFTQLLGINDSGEVVGFHGAKTASGVTLNLPSSSTGTLAITSQNYPNAAQTMVVAVNNRGSTAGIYVDSAGTTHGFTDVGGTFASINAPNTAFNQLLGINDVGQEAGYSSLDPTGQTKQLAYILQANGSFTYLTLPTNVNSQATGIDDSGDAVGFYLPTATTSNGFYLSAAGKLTILSAPGSSFTQALGINQEGQVVGFYNDSAGVTHGFLYAVSSGAWTTIDYPGASATTVNGINDLGQLSGFYVDSAGNTDGFVASVTGACVIPNPTAGQTITMPSSMTSLTLQGSAAVTVVNSASPGATITGNGAGGSYTMNVTGTMNAGAGNNTMVAAAPNSVMTAGDGNNTMVLTGAATGSSMTAGNGANQMFAFGSNQTMTAGNNSGNVLLAQITSSNVNMGAGNAFVFGNNNTVNVTTPNQVVSVNGSGETVNAGMGAAGTVLYFGQGATYNLATASNATASGYTEMFDTGAGATVKAGNGNLFALATAGGANISVGNGNALIGTGGTGNKVTVGNGNSAIFLGVGGTATLGSGNSAVVMSGSGGTANLGVGNSQIFSAGAGGNTYVLATGTTSRADLYGFDMAAKAGDQLDLTQALAGTNVKADLSNIGSFITTSYSGSDTMISAITGSTSSVIADLHGVGNLSLATLLSDNALRA